PFSDYWLENEIAAHRDRTKFAHPTHNRANPWGSQVWRWLRRYRGLPPATCRREFLRPNRYPDLPGACKRERHRLLRKSAEARRATDSTIAPPRAEDIAGQTFAVHPHQRRLIRRNRP